MPLERFFQPKLIKKLERIFPGIIVLKNDPNYLQGFPDLTLLYEDRWAVLETKKETNADRQVNQDYYVNLLNHMSYSDFVFPENEERILHDLQQTFGLKRPTRFPRRV